MHNELQDAVFVFRLTKHWKTLIGHTMKKFL